LAHVTVPRIHKRYLIESFRGRFKYVFESKEELENTDDLAAKLDGLTREQYNLIREVLSERVGQSIWCNLNQHQVILRDDLFNLHKKVVPNMGIGDEREMGRLEAKVDMLIEEVKSLKTQYVTKGEYEPRVRALEETHNKKWDMLAGIGSIGAMFISAIALFRTITIHWGGEIVNPQDFIKQVAPMAVVVYKHHRLSAALQIAQACLESGFGAHAPGNNLFGIKADPSWKGQTITLPTWEFLGGHWVPMEAKFRAYPTMGDSIVDHAKFLLYVNPGQTNRYANLVGAPYEQACRLIQQDGYATDPRYADKLLSIIRTYHLDQYDK
jgi:hypothetical protein